MDKFWTEQRIGLHKVNGALNDLGADLAPTRPSDEQMDALACHVYAVLTGAKSAPYASFADSRERAEYEALGDGMLAIYDIAGNLGHTHKECLALAEKLEDFVGALGHRGLLAENQLLQSGIDALKVIIDRNAERVEAAEMAEDEIAQLHCAVDDLTRANRVKMAKIKRLTAEKAGLEKSLAQIGRVVDEWGRGIAV